MAKRDAQATSKPAVAPAEAEAVRFMFERYVTGRFSFVKIAEMPESDRVMAERIHAIITANAPDLAPRTWYGMPAYARDGKVVCFFQSAEKFNARYTTFGFNDTANLDEGAMWPTSFALKELTAADEARISALVKKAVS